MRPGAVARPSRTAPAASRPPARPPVNTGRRSGKNLGWKLLGRGSTPATLKFLAEGLPYPKGGIEGPQGRFGVALGRTWQPVQLAFCTNQEARDLALSGTVAALPAGSPRRPRRM